MREEGEEVGKERGRYSEGESKKRSKKYKLRVRDGFKLRLHERGVRDMEGHLGSETGGQRVIGREITLRGVRDIE